MVPYSWGFSLLELDADQALQGKIGLRKVSGILQDGTSFTCPR